VNECKPLNPGDMLQGVLPSATSKVEEYPIAEQAAHSLPNETLKAHLQSLHSIEQKISQASAATQ